MVRNSFQLSLPSFVRSMEFTINEPSIPPSKYGQVERNVQELKRFLKKHSSLTPTLAVSKFLFMYRNTPHTTSQVTPSSLVLKFNPVTRLSFLKPAFGENMQNKQDHCPTPPRTFSPGDSVWVINYRDNAVKWLKALCLAEIGSSNILGWRLRVTSRYVMFM